MEVIDNTLLCLSDIRFTENLKSIQELQNLRVRVDHFTPDKRRILESAHDLDMTREWLIFLSQPLGKMSILLPHITNVASTAEDLFDIVCKKAGVEKSNLKKWEYILYAIQTITESDF